MEEEDDAWGWQGVDANEEGRGTESPGGAGGPEPKEASGTTGDIAPLQTAARLLGAKEKVTGAELRHGDGGVARPRLRRISPRCTDGSSDGQINDRGEATFVF